MHGKTHTILKLISQFVKEKMHYFDQCAATLECHATDTGHDTTPCRSIQTQGQPVDVQSIDVERHTGIHTYPF